MNFIAGQQMGKGFVVIFLANICIRDLTKIYARFSIVFYPQ